MFFSRRKVGAKTPSSEKNQLREEDLERAVPLKIHDDWKTTWYPKSGLHLTSLLHPRYVLDRFPGNEEAMKELRSLVPLQAALEINPLTSCTPLPLGLLSSSLSTNADRAINFYHACFYAHAKSRENLTAEEVATTKGDGVGDLSFSRAKKLFKLVFLPLALLENLEEIKVCVQKFLSKIQSQQPLRPTQEFIFIHKLFMYYWNLFKAVQGSCSTCWKKVRPPDSEEPDEIQKITESFKHMFLFEQTKQIDLILESSLRQGKVLAIVQQLNFEMCRAVFNHFLVDKFLFETDQFLCKDKEEDIILVTKVGHIDTDWQDVRRIQGFIANALNKQKSYPTKRKSKDNNAKKNTLQMTGITDSSPVSREGDVDNLIEKVRNQLPQLTSPVLQKRDVINLQQKVHGIQTHLSKIQNQQGENKQNVASLHKDLIKAKQDRIKAQEELWEEQNKGLFTRLVDTFTGTLAAAANEQYLV